MLYRYHIVTTTRSHKEEEYKGVVLAEDWHEALSNLIDYYESQELWLAKIKTLAPVEFTDKVIESDDLLYLSS
jgi:hypothetical protein